MSIQSNILLTGATGYLGSLVAAGLLSELNCKVIAPIRNGHSRESLIEKIKLDLPINSSANQIDFSRLITLELPPINEIPKLFSLLKSLGVDEVMHCAGSVDYFDTAQLKEVNIDFTNELITVGKQLAVKRFVYLSTAFSSGFVEGIVDETIHTKEGTDPTEYTRSKREAETLVSRSGLPYLILRPSIVIGDSHTGRYSGKPYGLYQYWSAFERFLCDRYREDLHFIAPKVKLHLIHQDAFQSAFINACKYLQNNSIVHLTSNADSLPTVHDVCRLWSEVFTDSKLVQFYSSLDEAPANGLDKRTRMWLEFTAVNSDIATHCWQFKTAALDKLRANGLHFRNATLDTVKICRDQFVIQSARIQEFLAKTKEQRLLTAKMRAGMTPSLVS